MQINYFLIFFQLNSADSVFETKCKWIPEVKLQKQFNIMEPDAFIEALITAYNQMMI